MTAQMTPDTRSNLLLLFPTAAIAGLGLGLLGLSASLPANQADPLPPPVLDVAQPETAEHLALQDLPVWAALFGEPAPEPVVVVAAPEPDPIPEPVPEPEPFPDEEPFFDTSMYVLRGLVYQDDGGWAILESDEGIVVIRQGDVLIGGEEITEIAEDGVEISIDGEYYFIGFDEYEDDFEDDFEEERHQPPSSLVLRRENSTPRGNRSTSPAAREQLGIGGVGGRSP